MKIGTRGSDLALWQARHVRALLQQAAGVDADLVIIKTAGDKDLDTPFVGMTGKGFFTKEIEDALLAGQIDLAVHSLKDLQTVMPDGLMLGAVPERADRRDILLIRREAFDAGMPLRLRHGAKVGTSSARRVAQLRFLRPDLVLEPLRGNVPTRVRKLSEGRYDAILAASAGLDRLELPLDEFHVYRLSESLLVPAPAQGALGLQLRQDDRETRAIVSRLDSPDLRQIVYLEREVLRRLEGGCQLALGTAAEKTGEGYRLATFLGDEQGGLPRRVIVCGRDPETIILSAVAYLKREAQRDLDGHGSVWITREPERAQAFIQAVASPRLEAVPVPVFVTVEAGDRDHQRRCLADLAAYDWVIFTSQVTVREFKRLLQEHRAAFSPTTRLAAVGKKTAQAMREAGWAPHFVGDVADAVSLAEQFAAEFKGAIGRVLFPCGAAAGEDLETGLAAEAGAFERLVCYDMVKHPQLAGCTRSLKDPAAVVFTSPQAARFLLSERSLPAQALPVAIGPATSEALLSLGCPLVFEAFDRSLEGTAEVIHGLFAL
jgi:hydroxymethylbilane synthase